MSRLQQRLDEGPLLVAEGFVFELERECLLQAGAFVPSVVLENPTAVRQLTDRFIEAGSDVVLALTYYTNEDKLRRVGLEGRLEEINKTALRIAHEAARDAERRFGWEYLVAGNICNTYEWEDYRDRGRYSREVLPGIRRQIGWAKASGVDYIVGETYPCFEEARLHLKAIKASGLPAVITLSARGDRTPEGLSYEDACYALSEEGADVVGLNCTRGPETMLPLLDRIRQRVPASIHVAALPVPYRTNPGEPTFLRLGRGQAFPTELDAYLCSRQAMAGFAVRARDMGIRYIGTCCGAGPHHVRAMAEALGRYTPSSAYSPDLTKHGALGRDADDAVRRAWEGDTILGAMDEMSPSAIARIYDKVAPSYREIVRSAGYVLPEEMAGRFRTLMDSGRIHPNDRIIDAGCGNGLSGIALRDAGFRNVYGLDMSAGLISQIPPDVYQPFDSEGVIEASLTNLPQRYWSRFDHVFSAGTIGHTATLDLEGIVRLGTKGGVVAFSVRAHHLGRYQEALGALRERGIWKSLDAFEVEDSARATAPHCVLVEEVIDDPAVRFAEVEEFFYRIPHPH